MQTDQVSILCPLTHRPGHHRGTDPMHAYRAWVVHGRLGCLTPNGPGLELTRRRRLYTVSCPVPGYSTP